MPLVTLLPVARAAPKGGTSDFTSRPRSKIRRSQTAAGGWLVGGGLQGHGDPGNRHWPGQDHRPVVDSDPDENLQSRAFRDLVGLYRAAAHPDAINDAALRACRSLAWHWRGSHDTDGGDDKRPAADDHYPRYAHLDSRPCVAGLDFDAGHHGLSRLACSRFVARGLARDAADLGCPPPRLSHHCPLSAAAEHCRCDWQDWAGDSGLDAGRTPGWARDGCQCGNVGSIPCIAYRSATIRASGDA